MAEPQRFRKSRVGVPRGYVTPARERRDSGGPAMADRISDENLAEFDKWLAVCGSCDAGVPGLCTCPVGDYRPAMLRLRDMLVAERTARDSAERLAEDRRLANEAVNAELAQARAERDALKRGAEHLGKIVDRQCRDVLWLTGAHDLIGDDGDGDWAAVWERLAAIVRERDALKARIDAVRDARDSVRGGAGDTYGWMAVSAALDGEVAK